mgnify:CR=1 FL=1
MSSFRYWLADLISGGEMTRADCQYWRLWEIAKGDREASAKRRYEIFSGWIDCEAELNNRLNRIAALETPNANATVRKMAKIARGEA